MAVCIPMWRYGMALESSLVWPHGGVKYLRISIYCVESVYPRVCYELTIYNGGG